MQPLGAVLDRPSVRPDLDDPEVIERHLLGLPETALVERALEAARAERAEHAEGTRPWRHLSGQIAAAERRLWLCRQRDLRQVARPAGCWCLGLGGRTRTAVCQAAGVQTDSQTGARTLEAPRVLFLDGEPLQAFRAYCDCRDGQRVRAEHAAQRQQAERELAARQRARLWDTLPETFRDATLDSYPRTTPAQRALVDQLRGWPEADGAPWLLLCGAAGRGKTGLAVGLSKACQARGLSALFVVTTDLLAQVRASFRDAEAASETDLMASLRDTDVLVLDDLGREYHRDALGGDWASERLYQVLNARYNAGRRTIVTANADPRGLAGALGHNGPYVVSRITGRATAAWVLDLSPLPNLRATVASR